jgi:hypothetical protein
VAELVDAADSKSVVGDNVLVRFRPGAPTFARKGSEGCRAVASGEGGLVFASYGSASPT